MSIYRNFCPIALAIVILLSLYLNSNAYLHTDISRQLLVTDLINRNNMNNRYDIKCIKSTTIHSYLNNKSLYMVANNNKDEENKNKNNKNNNNKNNNNDNNNKDSNDSNDSNNDNNNNNDNNKYPTATFLLPNKLDIKKNWKYGQCKHKIIFEGTETIKKMKFISDYIGSFYLIF